MVNFLEPMKLDRAMFEDFHCNTLDKNVTMIDAYAILRDSPVKSYVISNPCIRASTGDDDKAICFGDENRAGACKKHYRNLIYLADKNQIEIKDLKTLKNHETNIAHLPENLYWKFIQKESYPVERRELFISRVNRGSRYVKDKIEEDLTRNKTRTRKKLLNVVKHHVHNLNTIDFKKESKRYSFAETVGEVLEAMNLIKTPDMSTIQLDDGLGWYVYAQTPWNDEQYFILNLENTHTSAGLIRSETIYDSGIISLVDEEIDKIIDEEELISSSGAFARIARGLDDIRWEESTGMEAVKV